MDRYDVAIVGAGIVGLATAWSMSARGVRVVVLDRRASVGSEQSTHNSGVVHTGAFLPPGTERARLAVAGRPLLLGVAEQLGVPVEPTGLLAVACSPGDIPRLERYAAWAKANGAAGTAWLDDREARVVEPALATVSGALHQPSGARIDTDRLVGAVEAELRRRGVAFEFGFDVRTAEDDGHWWRLGADLGAVESEFVVNAAGVGSGLVADRLGLGGYRIHPCLGEYARVVDGPGLGLRSMIYGIAPVGYPGIGAHLTRRTDGAVLVGPTATYISTEVPPPDPIESLAAFAADASHLIPGVREADLRRAPSGVRAKLLPPGSDVPFGDFVVRPGPLGSRTFHALGIESPGLTASFAIGAEIDGWRAAQSAGRTARAS